MGATSVQGPIDVFHNVRWARYKGAVFTELAKLAANQPISVRIFQIADTEADRVGLSPVDLSFHDYPHELLFEGAYEAVPRLTMLRQLAIRVLKTDAQLVVLPGYHRPEHWLMLAVARLRGIRCAAFCDSTAYDRPQAPLKSFAKRVFFSRCAAVFCYGTRSREYVLMHGGAPDRVHDKVMTAALEPGYHPDDAFAMRISRAPNPSAPRYLFVGRLAPEKNLDTLLKAFALIRRRYSEATLTLVGIGPLDDSLRRLAIELDVASYTEFRGAAHGSQLVEEYLKSTSLILPSASETWGLVVNEALSYGCPAIVSDRCGCAPDLIENGVNGKVFPVGNAEALCGAMEESITWSIDCANAARACIDSVLPYTPQRAAQRLLDGCRLALS